MVSLEKAKKIMGDKAKNMSDKQILKVLEDMNVLARLSIDQFLAMAPEERKEFSKEHHKSDTKI